jgi:pyruvate carboxylase
VLDRGVGSKTSLIEKAEASNPRHVSAPCQGVVTTKACEGQAGAGGDVAAVIEAMKMEAAITAPIAGTVERVVVRGPQSADGGT